MLTPGSEKRYVFNLLLFHHINILMEWIKKKKKKRSSMAVFEESHLSSPKEGQNTKALVCVLLTLE